MTTYSWVANTQGRWTSHVDWSPSGTTTHPSPALPDDGAIISQSIGRPYTVVENFSGTIADLTIGSTDATLRFRPATTLTVSDVAINDGTIVVGNGAALGFGVLENDGSVMLRGGGLSGAGGSIVDNGIIAGTGTVAGGLSGNGVVEVTPNGRLELVDPINSASIAFDIANSGVLQVDGPVNASANFDFKSSAGGVLDIGTTFNGIISGMNVGASPTDPTTVIDVQATIDSAAVSGSSLILSDGQVINLGNSFPAGTNVILSPDSVLGGTDIFFSSAPCYVAGTRILTANGEIAVENLHEGDSIIILTNDGMSEQKVKWIGQRVVELANHPRPDLAAPVLIRRDAVDAGQPHRDLLVSPDHCLFVEGKLVPALMLVNDMTIVQESNRASVHYFHVELEQHSILLAEGLPAESYLDTGNRAMFANAGVAILLHPDFNVNGSLRTWQDDACAPLAVDPVTLQPIWGRLADRAAQLGFVPRRLTLATEPDMRAVVAGRSIAPLECRADRYVFLLPKGTDRVVLSSRATRPADIVRYLDDRRKLGVAVGSITLRAGDDIVVFPADHIPAGTGWHAAEGGPDSLWRWTNGAGEIRLDPLAQATLMEIRLSGTAEYIIEESAPRVAA